MARRACGVGPARAAWGSLTERLALLVVLVVLAWEASTAVAHAQYGGAVPRHCGMIGGRETYGAIVPGATVVLGMHTPWAGDANWSPEMGRFVGSTARVTALGGVDSAGCPGVRVDVDGGQYFWRIRDAQLAGGMDIPRQCDFGSGVYGPIGPGSAVLLGAHTPWRGDANWAPEMFGWVGRMARVTSLEGVDSVGCPVVRVDVDGGQYYWRIRDMQLAGGSMPMGMAAAVPRYCDMTSATVTYGSLQPGSVIVLGRHSPWSGDANWSPEMERFVGTRARVTSLAGIDSSGCPGVRVDIDGGQWFWRVRDASF